MQHKLSQLKSIALLQQPQVAQIDLSRRPLTTAKKNKPKKLGTPSLLRTNNN